MNVPESVEITEVGPRDGFQNIEEWIPTETKIDLIGRLIHCGFKKIEVTAFVHPKAVPQMADAKEIVRSVKASHPDVEISALVPNIRGVTDALEAGADTVNYIISASERHNFENTRQPIERSLENLAEVCRMKGNRKICLAIPTAFVCPWTGLVPFANVENIIARGLEYGVDDVGIADTLGSANPALVYTTVSRLRTRFPDREMAMHFHDTRGMGLANVIAAMQAGATRFESAIGGLGGCPFAPGAAGNIATEDLVNMLEEMGVTTGIDLASVMATVFRAKEVLPVPINSNMIMAITCEMKTAE
ncbi:MAG: hydroxymethylglutaryl-CoA lyase [Desulfopila sp.]